MLSWGTNPGEIVPQIAMEMVVGNKNVMIMQLEFKEITLQDRDWMRKLFSWADNRATEFNFTVLYIWREIMNTRVARYKDFLLARFKSEGAESFLYFFPAGRGTSQELCEAIEACMADAKENGYPFLMASVQQEQKEVLENLFPDRFLFEPYRNSFDYIYSAEDLVFLKGKKFQSKRNFISRFKKQEGWSYEPVGKNNLKECAFMSIRWCAKYGCGKDPSKASESCSVKNALANFEELGLCGGALRLNGEIVAFTLAEKTSSDTLLVHVEKAYADIVGAYPTIANEFLRHTIVEDEATGQLSVKYINREDDAGDLGLREAKMQYHPLFLLEKYSVKEK